MAKRMLVMVLGIILFLVGASAAVAGGALMLVFGSDSTISSGPEPLTTKTTALVASMNDIKDTNGVASTVGQPTLGLSAVSSTRDVFIGIGPAAAVEQYLAGTSIDRVRDLDVDPFTLKTTVRPGTATPADPAAQTFWTARGVGPNPAVSWKVKDGSYRLVLMNADSSPGVTANGRVSLNVPNLFGIGIGILAGGVVVGLAGLGLLIAGVRMHQYRPPAMSGGPGYPGPGGYPGGPSYSGSGYPPPGYPETPGNVAPRGDNAPV